MNNPTNRQTVPPICLVLFLLSLLQPGCLQQSESKVIVFSALDREFSEPIFKQFTKNTDIQVLAKFDTESTKTVGLANQILQQKESAACDLFWNNEILHTLRLERAGKLQAMDISAVEHFPKAFRSPSGNWVGLAARARVIIVNTKLLDAEEQRPSSILDMTSPKWKGKVCIAKPLFGTTATHFAVLYQQLGEQKFSDLIERIQSNEVGILSGNRQVAADVAAGKYSWGITDTDDFHIEKLAGSDVQLIFPDQESDQQGCLLIPNTLALIHGGQNQPQAIKLVERLLSGVVEKQLAVGPSAQIPLDDRVNEVSPLVQSEILWMETDWSQTVDAWDRSSKILTDAFY